MKMKEMLICLLLSVALCTALVSGVAMAATTDTGTAGGTLSDISEISATDAAIAFGAITASASQNVVQNSATDKLTFSTGNSNTAAFWKGEVTGATCPSGETEADVKTWAYWTDASSEKAYPALIDIDATGATGCTITEAWADQSATIPGSGGNEVKSAEFTVKYHGWADADGVAASTATHRVVFTDTDKVFVKEGDTDWSFVTASADLTADATALEVSTGNGEKNFLLTSDSEPIGEATYVLTALTTTGGSEAVTLQIGDKFAFTGSAQTQDFYALVDIPNLSAAGAYTWTITLTTAKWNAN